MTPDLGSRTTDCPQCGAKLTVVFGLTEDEQIVGWTGPHPCPNWQAQPEAVAA